MDVDDEYYKRICNIRTVQSDKHGFFNDFYMEVMGSCGDKWLHSNFGELQTNESRILAIFNDDEVCGIVRRVLENVKAVYKKKDTLFSMRHRAQADKFHCIGHQQNKKEQQQQQQALIHANLAVMRAPAKGIAMDVDNGLSLALALYSRAAILIALNEGTAALIDLKLAAANGLEINRSPDYYIKMAKAYASISEMARAEISMGVAAKLGGCDITRHRQELPLLQKSSKSKEMTPPLPQLAHGESDVLHGASAAITLSQTTAEGRFMIANGDINTGDVVHCEAPIAACLLPTHHGTHCYHCFKRLFVPIPCLHCAGIGFCSTQCMNEACGSYHRFECHFMDLLIGSGMSILCYIALRIFTQASDIDAGLRTATQLIENLCSHMESRRADDHLQRSLMVAFLLRCLQQAEYFGRREHDDAQPTSLELQVSVALLGLLYALQYNAHEIYETMLNANDGGGHCFDGSNIVYVGAGIYATAAYFNHECWPSLARHFNGKHLILTAMRPHRKNQMLAENYGPIFTKTNRMERQKILSGRYLFHCRCSVCLGNWPTFNKLNNDVKFCCPSINCKNFLISRDLQKDVHCAQCRKNVSLRESIVKLLAIEEAYSEAAQAMQNQRVAEAIALFRESIDQFFTIAVLPHKRTLIAQQSLIKCLALAGNTARTKRS